MEEFRTLLLGASSHTVSVVQGESFHAASTRLAARAGVLAMCERCIHPAPDASRGIAYEWRSLRSVSSGSPSVRCSGGGDSSSYSAPGSVDGH